MPLVLLHILTMLNFTCNGVSGMAVTIKRKDLSRCSQDRRPCTAASKFLRPKHHEPKWQPQTPSTTIAKFSGDSPWPPPANSTAHSLRDGPPSTYHFQQWFLVKHGSFWPKLYIKPWNQSTSGKILLHFCLIFSSFFASWEGAEKGFLFWVQ